MNPTQIGILVPDLAEGIAAWTTLVGGDEWAVYSFTPESFRESRYRGEPGRFSLRAAFHGTAPQIELIEPRDGPSIYHEWIERHGYGLHHLGIHVPAGTGDPPGLEPVQMGSGFGLDGDGRFAYYDRTSDLGVWIELIEPAARRRPPESL